MARITEGARVLVLGEQHTDWEQKLFQARLLETLARRGNKVVLGLEFFYREHTETLERWRRGEIGSSELLSLTGWYDRGSIRFAYYEGVLEIARNHGMPIVGLNVPRSILRKVSTAGMDALDADQRSDVGTVSVDGSPQHRYLFARYMGDTGAQMPAAWLDKMYAAQCLWDVVMARSILDRLPADGILVAVVGSAHVAYGLGIPRRIDEEREAAGEPRVPVVTFCPVTAPPPSDEGEHGHPMAGHHRSSSSEPQGRFVRSLADVVGVFPATGGLEKWPTIGLQIEDSDDGSVVVKRVWPDTPAAEMGLQKGDRLVSLNGVEVGTATDLRLALATFEWGRRLALEIQRSEEMVEVATLLFPEVVTTTTTAVPGWTEVASAPLEPGSAAVAEPLFPAPTEGETWSLVRHHGIGVRLEARRGSRLTAVHELDGAGRVERSVFLAAADDGAVEIVYRRDDTGNVIGSLRLDERSEVIR
jgi:uncharacterized iron-regulated protein